MAKLNRASSCIFALALVFVAFHTISQPAFLPPASQPARLPTAGVSMAAGALGATFASAPALADPIEENARKFADAMYPLMEKVDWDRDSTIVRFAAESAKTRDPIKVAALLDAILQVGIDMDLSLIKQGVLAHINALDNAAGRANLVAPLSDVEEITVAVSRMLASSSSAKIMAVKTAMDGINAPDFYQDAMNGFDVGQLDQAYQAFVELAQAVKMR